MTENKENTSPIIGYYNADESRHNPMHASNQLHIVFSPSPSKAPQNESPNAKIEDFLSLEKDLLE